ncbi:TetR/AcrR family transcriptional regulator [Actinoalloteichus sp. AHMU CJ021]|uniref:TetR/AcrR family transcriptional regulator n=1 Tax=Actinoalloteichus sp. AHMU CJ021 TaxID=2072503 RepID=UPI0026B4770F
MTDRRPTSAPTGQGTSEPASACPPPEAVPRSTAEVARRLALLWDPPTPSPLGRRARLSLTAVVDAAIGLVQESGLEALSMRGVAARLGVGAMSLYTYVPGRTELVDLMIDRAYEAFELPDPEADWRPALEQYARQLHALLGRHPWMLTLNRTRLPLAPHVLDADEAGLRTLIDTGLPEHRVVEVVELVNGLVWGLASTAAREAAESSETGQGYGEYWQEWSGFWVTYFDVERYPTMTRVYQAGAFDDGVDFDRVLGRLLDSVENTIDQYSTGASPASRHD